jgi:hypothetical protein
LIESQPVRPVSFQGLVKTVVNAAFRPLARLLLSLFPSFGLPKMLGARVLSVVQKPESCRRKTHDWETTMSVLAFSAPILMAAAGYSLIYLLMGGGLGGAILIFIVAKMLGK